MLSSSWTRLVTRSFRTLAIFPLVACLVGAFFAASMERVAAAGELGTVPVILVFHSDSSDVAVADLRRALSARLGSPVVSPEDRVPAVRGTVTVTYRRAAGELAVSYDEAGRGTVARIIKAPKSAEGVVDAASMLAANLARDEAAELLPLPGPSADAGADANDVGDAAADPSEGALDASDASAPSEPMTDTSRADAGLDANDAGARNTVPATAAFVHPLATNHDDEDVDTMVQFNLLYGRVGSASAIQLGGVNHTLRSSSGLSLAWIGNVSGGTSSGLDLAFGFNRSAREVRALQASLAFNSASADVAGAQLAFGFNGAEKVTGFQGAALNVADALEGGAVGAINVSGDVRGFQLGFVNVAEKVRGLQFGLVNVADDVEGIPIGLVSVTRSGGVHPKAWFSTKSYANVGVEFATRYTYTMLSASGHVEGSKTLFGPGFTIGARIPTPHVFVDVDLGITYLFHDPKVGQSAEAFVADDAVLTRVRALVGHSFERHLSVFAGGGLVLDWRFPDGSTVNLRAVPEFVAGVGF
ncbi:MAG: hypothetical protein U0169_15010 [Polyangiaceae bacterium]